MSFSADLRERLGALEPRRCRDRTGGQAAVLMALRIIRSEPHFVLTRRTETVATHKGQISFPGGVREEEDRSLVQTALRETEEEIGIPVESVDVLGEFHDYRAITGFVVRPVVGVIREPVRFLPFEPEVAYILEVPLSFFRETSPVVRHRIVRGERANVYYYDYQGENIWGLTARMIRDFVAWMDDSSGFRSVHERHP
jgi:8-oxo-dGTP pyrophosphatase MutT (NUDIX family)